VACSSPDGLAYCGMKKLNGIPSPRASTAGKPNVWFARQSSFPETGLRLYCFPWSGASSSVFRSWADRMPSHIDVVPVQLPGRGSRSSEPPSVRLAPLARQISLALEAELSDYPNSRIALYGHSFGSLLAYETASWLETRGIYPELVVLSGSRPPTVAPRHQLHQLPDKDLLIKIELMGGIRPERLRNVEFLDYLMPLVRADLTACETHRSAEKTGLRSPVAAWAGNDDWYAPQEDTMQWRWLAKQDFRHRLFNGGHFFIADEGQTIAAFLEDLAWASACSPRPKLARSSNLSGVSSRAQ
jgi:medium-chain acyl-[acyl-carrier-protein] hydrolase